MSDATWFVLGVISFPIGLTAWFAAIRLSHLLMDAIEPMVRLPKTDTLTRSKIAAILVLAEGWRQIKCGKRMTLILATNRGKKTFSGKDVNDLQDAILEHVQGEAK